MARLRRHRGRPARLAAALMIAAALAAAVGGAVAHLVGGASKPLAAGSGHRGRPRSRRAVIKPRKLRTDPLPVSYLIHVPPKDQYPALPNGCEVTSLAMLMTAAGHPVSKMVLAAEMPKDPTQLVLSSYTNANGQTAYRVKYWGNPNVGFVGSVYKAGDGYGIYHGPMVKFLNRLLPGRAEDLTGAPFSAILRQVARGIPVEVWTTTTFAPTNDWVTWQSPEGLVRATPWEHAVLLVGYSPGFLYINNPLNGEAAEKIAEGPFLQSWQQLGDQAITYRPASSAR